MEQNNPSITPDDNQSATPANAMATDTTPSLEELLQASERKAQEHYDAWMYAKAESENIRRLRAHRRTNGGGVLVADSPCRYRLPDTNFRCRRTGVRHGKRPDRRTFHK